LEKGVIEARARLAVLNLGAVMGRIEPNAHAMRLNWALDQHGCVYGAMRGLSFDDYFGHLSLEHKEQIGQRYDRLTAG